MTNLLTPLTELDLSISAAQKNQLSNYGIVTLAQLSEMLRSRPSSVRGLGLDPDKLMQSCLHQYECLQQEINFGCAVQFLPPLGWVLDPQESQILVQHRHDTQEERALLAAKACEYEARLPDECLLIEGMAPVRHQLNLGACTGFGSTAAREYLVEDILSPGFLYRLAKQLDGMPEVEGSYQQYCYEGMVQYGHVSETSYSYDQCLQDVDISPWLREASRFSIDHYMDLIVEPEYQSTVLKAALSGALSPDLSPRPVSISVAVYDSFLGDSARRFGLIPLPFDGETLQGGHAMAVAGYTQLYDTTYFVIQNSWGSDWAKESPITPGYALIPESFINQQGLVGELLMPL